MVPGAGPSGSTPSLRRSTRLLRAIVAARERCASVSTAAMRLARVDVGSLEQAQGELEPQDAPERVVERSGVHVAALDRREQRFGEAVAGRKLDVDAGAQRQDSGLGLAAGEAVVGGELIDREIVGDDDAVEAPRASQDPVEQVLVRGTRHPVELVVAVHHRRQPSRRGRPPRTGGGRPPAAHGRARAPAPSSCRLPTRRSRRSASPSRSRPSPDPAPAAPRRRPSPCARRGTRPRRRSPRSAPSAGRARRRAPATAPDGRPPSASGS